MSRKIATAVSIFWVTRESEKANIWCPDPRATRIFSIDRGGRASGNGLRRLLPSVSALTNTPGRWVPGVACAASYKLQATIRRIPYTLTSCTLHPATRCASAGAPWTWPILLVLGTPCAAFRFLVSVLFCCIHSSSKIHNVAPQLPSHPGIRQMTFARS